MTYAERKERAREQAINWQDETVGQSLSYGELAEAMARFETLGRRYGLTAEFRENGII